MGIEPTAAEAPVVLIVEDDEVLARSLVRSLAAHGYAVAAAASAEEAEAIIDAAVPAMLLLDIDLPDGPGWAVARRIRQTNSQTVITIMSGLPANPRLVQEIGCSGVLVKPFPIETLIRHVETAFGGSSTARPALTKEAP